MAYTTETIKDLLRLGGNVTINGAYTPESLKDFARLANSSNVMLTIKANNYTPDLLKDLSRLGKENVTIEL
jgi:hypothetical protein